MTAVTDYASLVSFVTDHLQLDSDTAAQIPAFIALAEASLNRLLTVPQREEQATLTSTAGVNYIALPADLRQIRTVYFDSDYPLAPVTLNVLLGYSDSSGKPQVYTVADQSLYLGPTPDAAYSMVVTYMTTIPALTSGNTTNWLITQHPDAYVYAVLMQAEAYRANDARIPLLSSALADTVDQINKAGVRYRNAAPIRLRSSVVV